MEYIASTTDFLYPDNITKWYNDLDRQSSVARASACNIHRHKPLTFVLVAKPFELKQT